MTVAIAGAGLGGLTAALALARHGVRVAVIERAEALSEVGAGLQLSPNATRILRRLGVLGPIEAAAVRIAEVRIRRWRDGADITRLPLGDAAARRYGAPFLVAHRADVQAALRAGLDAAPGVTLTLGERVESFAPAPDGIDLTLAGPAGSRRLGAAGLVGADGLHSAVRSALYPDPADAPRFSGRIAWRGVVPAEDAPPEACAAASHLWLGPDAHLVHYPLRGGALVNVVAILGGAGAREAVIEGWSAPGDPARLRGRLAGWAPAAHRLIAAVPDWRVWPLHERPALPAWSRGPVTLLGDAAHPMLPFLAQGAAQAIEDGWALGEAAGRAPDFAGAARLYEDARRPVATRVQRESRRQGGVYHLRGPLALARDAIMGVLGPDRMQRRYDWLYGPPDAR